MKRSTILFLIFIATYSFAQPVEVLKFNEDNHDFGLIKEVDGTAEFQFEFTNTAQEPVKITNVRASCGCTTPAWTREPVMPGEKGFIKVAYNPINRPGAFHKTLTVSTDSKQSTIVLRIQGKVEPKPRTVEDDFPTVMDGIRVKYRAFNMGRVYTNKPTSKEFEIYNQSNKPIAFSPKVEGPPYVIVTFNPQKIEPMQKGKVVITYDGKQRNELGFMSDNIVFHTDEEGEAANKIFSVYADINEYFDPMSPELAANAPRLVIAEKVNNFGAVDQGSTVEASFMLKNDGKTPLNIRKMHASCGCTVASLVKEDLAPGEVVEMKVAFNTTGRRGNQQKSITIYSNDPVTPVQRVTVKAAVQMPKNN